MWSKVQLEEDGDGSTRQSWMIETSGQTWASECPDVKNTTNKLQTTA